MLCSKNVQHQKHEYVFLLSFTVKPPWALTTDLRKVSCADKGDSVWFCCFVPWAPLVHHDQESRHVFCFFFPFFLLSLHTILQLVNAILVFANISSRDNHGNVA